MTERCETVAVLGAGVMGTGIAAHLAGAGIRTFLLDILPTNLTDAEKGQPAARNRLALTAIDRALKSKPATFYDPDAARLVTPGNFDDHLAELQQCDLIIEAVVERMDIKKALFARLAPHVQKGAILASNTSGLSLAEMTRELPEALQKQFCVMHFFNPVRYMRLLELVPGPKTEPAVMARAARIGEFLGKGVVYGKDTPNFVANRIGVYSIMQVFRSMTEFGLTIEEVDKIVGKPMGRPASAAFRTSDIVGIDTLLHVAKNCYDSLTQDEERDTFVVPEWVAKLSASGRTGQKAGAGFYKKKGDEILVLDVGSLEYRPQNKVRYESLGAVKSIEDVGERLKALVNADDKAGQFAWRALSTCLAYTARRVGEIANDIVNIDRAMRWGFNWELGPFEAWDAIGVPASVERMKKDGLKVAPWVEAMLKGGRTSFYDGSHAAPRYYDVNSKTSATKPRDPHAIRLAAVHEDKSRVVKENMGASLLDLGDGCLCLEVHTKMNTIDNDVIEMMGHAVTEAERNFEALVVANDGEHFGAGANLMLVYMAAQQKAWDQVATVVKGFQDNVQRLRYARVPVVTAPFQYAFGGAAELAMAGDVAQAHAETYMGLVEVGVGLVPAGGGCLRMVERWTDTVAPVEGADLLPFVGQASLNIATAKVSTGAEEARRLRYLLPTDGISLNRDHQLYEAKMRALGMARAGYRPPRPKLLKAAGLDAARTIGMRVWGMMESGFATAHDGVVANKVAHVLCGGHVAAGSEVTEQHFLDLEREAFLSLCGEEKSQARMQSILMTNKPLRN
jgi:3-hydroxyacyl-CoA dehydrogenase